MTFIFTCKHKSPDHPPQERLREKTSSGTSNIKATAEQCDRAHGNAPEPATSTSLVPSYTPASLRTAIAMYCATSHCPFAYVHDKWYKYQVEMLRPGTPIPDPATVSRDAKALYLKLSVMVKAYFAVRVLLSRSSYPSKPIRTRRSGIFPSTLLWTAGPL